jgi:tellurium resistance protein TerD
MAVPNMNQEEDKIACPKCGSTQLYADKKGYSGKKACLGFLLTGPLGLLCGTHKSRKVLLTCLKCKHTW